MKSKILTNVLLCSKNNLLRLANIVFDSTIIDIQYLSSTEIKWEDISTKDKWNRFALQQNEITKSENSINGEFMLLIPGGIDPHVHFNTPGFEEREDFEHASMAAAFGGVTTVIDMPCTSIPPVTTQEHLNIKRRSVSGNSYIDFVFWGGVSGNDFENGKTPASQILELAESGVAGFKAYLISGMDTFTDLSLEQMTQTARWVKDTSLPLAVHAEDKTIVSERRDHLQKIGNNNWQAYYFARDERAEALAVMKMIDISRQTGCKIHIVHLSSQFGIELIRQAKNEGLPVTAETCPHYLYFTKDDFENPEISTFLKTAPPVKTEFDRLVLWEALNDGILEFVTTDHAGCDPEKEKKGNDFWKIYGGIPGVEHRVPFLFSEGFKRGRLTIENTINLLCTNAANYFKLKSKGKIARGYDSDFALVNLWENNVIEAEKMHSKGKYTPFEGITFYTTIGKTFVRGKIVVQEDKILNEKNGRLIQILNREN